MSLSFPERSLQSHPIRRSTVELEEQRTWVGFYKRVAGDAALAAEVMAQLDGDAEMKRRHLALYLSCKQSLRVQRVRQARDKRIGQWLRLLVQLTLMRPVAFIGNAAQRALRRSGAVLAELMSSRQPGSSTPPKHDSLFTAGAAIEPAKAQVRNLLGDAEFADAHARFQQQGSTEHATQPREESAAPALQFSRR